MSFSKHLLLTFMFTVYTVYSLKQALPSPYVHDRNVSPPVSKLVICDTVTTSANLNILWTDDSDLLT